MKFKNEVFVGLMVVASLIVVAFGAFWLSGRPFGEEQRELVAIFQQVGQLRSGNPVVYRGVSVGRVTEIQLPESGVGVLVRMEVDAEIQFPPDVAVVLAPQSLFGDWQAQIASQSTYPALEFVNAGVPDILPGAALPDISELAAVAARIANDVETLSTRFELAFTEETAINLRQTIDNVQEATAQLSGFVAEQGSTLEEVSDNVLAATENFRETTETVERVAEQIETTFTEGEVQQILANARQASENLEELSVQLQDATEGVPALVAQADTTLETVGQVAVSLDSTLQSLQPQLQQIGPTLVEARQALATLERAATRIEQGEGTLGRLLEDPALYEETQAAVATLRRLMADLQTNPAKYIGAVEIF